MANSRNYDALNGKRNIVGDKIKQYRLDSKFSRQSLSNKLMLMGFDIQANSIYDIENGLRTVTDYEICAIAKALKIPVKDLLNDYYNSIENV